MTHTELKNIRKGLSLSKREMAEQLGLHYVSYTRYESGNREMPGTTVRLVRALALINLMVPGGIDCLAEAG